MAAVDTLKSDEATAQEEEERKGIISRVMNLDVKVDKGGTRATVVLPGLSYDDFDRTDSVGFWKISVLVLKCRDALSFAAKYNQGMIEYQRPANIAAITVGSKLKVHKVFYEKTREGLTALATMKIEANLLEIGGRSYGSVVDVLDVTTGQVLVSQIDTYVYVDTKTKRSMLLPQIFKEKAVQANIKNSSTKYPRLALPTGENEIFKYTMTASHSDTDGNRHVNRTVYLRYISDAGTAASMKGFYTNFHGDLAKHKANELTILYREEVKPDTEIDIFTWEDVNNKQRLYFKIMKESTHFTDCVIDFYKSEDSKL